jgi:hypothetical protein
MEIVFDYYSKVEGALEKIRQALEAARWAAENTPMDLPSYIHRRSSKKATGEAKYLLQIDRDAGTMVTESELDKYFTNVKEYFGNYREYGYTRDEDDRFISYTKIDGNGDPVHQFNTGGYTGTWGPDGRWALLHQKELILNAQDTENFLSALGILHSLVKLIDLQAINNAFNTSQLKSSKAQAYSQTLEQQVNIHAEFPNVTNHYEIEEALNNIVNSASQYANRKI